MKNFIVIPAFNAEKFIREVIQDLFSHGYTNLIVVNDGSTDGTLEILLEFNNIQVLHHEKNLGQGAALRTGIKASLNQEAAYITTFDSDTQHQAKDILPMLELLKNKKLDIVLGSRFLGSHKGIPFFRWICLKLGKILVNLLYGLSLSDPQNGLRVMTREAALKISFSSNGMEHAGEILGEVSRNILKFREVPVDIIYSKSILKNSTQGSAFGLLLRMITNSLKKSWNLNTTKTPKAFSPTE